MHPYKLITISKTGTIYHYKPPQKTPHKTLQSPPPDTISNTLPLLTHQKSSITHPSTKTRLPTAPLTALTSKPPLIATGNSEGFVTILYPGHDVTVPLHIKAVTELRFCDSAENLVSSGIDGFVHITRLCDPTKPLISIPHPLPVTNFLLGYFSTTARLITTSPDHSTRVYHASSAKLLTTIRHPQRVTALALGPGEDFWWGGSDGAVGRIDINALPVGAVVQATHFTTRDTAVTAMTHSPEGIVVAFEDGLLQTFHPVTNVLLRSFGTGDPVIGVFVQFHDEDDTLPPRDFLLSGRGQGAVHAWQDLKRFDRVFEDDVVYEPDVNLLEIRRLVDEVETLTKRNRQLEDAGSELIQLVERAT